MKRSSWKYIPATYLEYYHYISTLLKLTPIIKTQIAPRIKIITKLSQNWNSIHQGKNYTLIKYYPFRIGLKYGAFSKTRKPFFF